MGLGRPVLRVAGAAVAPLGRAWLQDCWAGEHGLAALRRVLKAPVPCPQLLRWHPWAALWSQPHYQHHHSGPVTKHPELILGG